MNVGGVCVLLPHGFIKWILDRMTSTNFCRLGNVVFVGGVGQNDKDICRSDGVE